MVVDGTGGFGQPARTEVSYIWNLPAGWKDFTTGKTGEFGTTTRSITIVPLACAEPGVIVVKGSLWGSTPNCTSSAFSSPINISLNTNLGGSNPIVSVVPPAGFIGTTACNTTPVTFTAQIAQQGTCIISSYDWKKPGSWTIVSQSGNAITLQPSGSAADAGQIEVTATLGCGSKRSATFTPSFIPPAIVGSAVVCNSSSYSVANVQGVQIAWSSSNPSGLSINATTGAAVRVNNFIGDVTVTATISGGCGSIALTRVVTVGNTTVSPQMYLNGSPTPVSNTLWAAAGTILNFSTNYYENSNYQWQVVFPSPPYNIGSNSKDLTFQMFNAPPFQVVTLLARVSNVCGLRGAAAVSITNQTGSFAMYPNPSTTQVTIEAITHPESKKDATASYKERDANELMISRDVAFTVELYDSRSVLRKSETSVAGTIVLSTADLPTGLYYLKITSNGHIEKQQIQVKH